MSFRYGFSADHWSIRLAPEVSSFLCPSASVPYIPYCFGADIVLFCHCNRLSMLEWIHTVLLHRLPMRINLDCLCLSQHCARTSLPSTRTWLCSLRLQPLLAPIQRVHIFPWICSFLLCSLLTRSAMQKCIDSAGLEAHGVGKILCGRRRFWNSCLCLKWRPHIFGWRTL